MVAIADPQVLAGALDVLNTVMGGEEVTPERVKAAMRRLPIAQMMAVDRMLGLPEPESFRAFIKRTQPKFVFYRWLNPLLDALQDVADGKLYRLIVQAPPRVGKSEVVSRLFPAYYLTRFPWRTCGLGSHTATLAQGFSRHARRNFIAGGGMVSTDSRAVKEWETTDLGGMWSVGFKGGALGKGAHLAVIDDPSKSRKDLSNVGARETLMELYETVFYSRLEPDAALIIMAQRMHDRDLIGNLLAREDGENKDDEFDAGELGSERWRLIDFPSIAEKQEDRPKYPKSIEVVPEFREPGEALVPERFPLKRLKRIQIAMGPSAWSSMHQQRPRPRSGTLFKYEWFEKRVTATHATAYRVRYWDLAGTQGDGDYTVGLLMSFNPGNRIPFIVEDVVRGQWSPAARNAKIKETADADARKYTEDPYVVQYLEADAGVHGKDRTRTLVGLLAGHIVKTERPTGDKEVRADPVAGQAEVGNVQLIEASWNSALIDELCAFLGGGEHDDQVDALSGAFNKLVEMIGEEWSEEEFALV